MQAGEKTMSGSAGELVKRSATLRKFRIIVAVTLVILSVQGWFGDTVNIFYVPPSGTTAPSYSAAGFLGAVESLGFPLLWHAFEGIFLVGLAAVIFGLSFRWTKSRSVRITSGLGLLMVVSAAIGGFLFVMSGFANGGNSAEMGGSFIGSYAFYFLTLYYSK
jgi:hypothetical protein